MHAYVRRERHHKADAEGLVPKCRGGRAHRADTDDEPQPKAEPEYNQMNMEHQVEDDDVAEEDVGDDDNGHQQQRCGKRVPEPKPNPEPLDEHDFGKSTKTIEVIYKSVSTRTVVNFYLAISLTERMY